MIKSSTFYKNDLANMRLNIISSIDELITVGKALEIDINDGPIFQYVDDQFSEVVGRINTERMVAIIDSGSNMYDVPLVDLSTDLLLDILESIERGDYEVFESIEE